MGFEQDSVCGGSEGAGGSWCVVGKIEYDDSLCFDNVTRHACRQKVKMQEDTLQVLRDYLQIDHMKDKHKDLPNEWKLCTMCNVPQQDTTNTTDCDVIVCMYCNFILNDCKLDFN